MTYDIIAALQNHSNCEAVVLYRSAETSHPSPKTGQAPTTKLNPSSRTPLLQQPPTPSTQHKTKASWKQTAPSVPIDCATFCCDKAKAPRHKTIGCPNSSAAVRCRQGASESGEGCLIQSFLSSDERDEKDTGNADRILNKNERRGYLQKTYFCLSVALLTVLFVASPASLTSHEHTAQ